MFLLLRPRSSIWVLQQNFLLQNDRLIVASQVNLYSKNCVLTVKLAVFIGDIYHNLNKTEISFQIKDRDFKTFMYFSKEALIVLMYLFYLDA